MTMNKKWRLAGAVIVLAIAIPVSAYAAADGTSQKNPDKKYHVISINKSGVKTERKDARIDVLELAVAKLGLDKAAIEAAAKDGKSLTDLAKEKGIALQPIIDALTAQLEAEIRKSRDSEVQLTDEEKNNIQLKVSTEVNRVVTEPLAEQLKANKREQVIKVDHGVAGVDVAEIAITKFGIAKDAYVKAVKDGKSLAELAKEKGIALQPIIDELTKQLLVGLDKAGDSKELTVSIKKKVSFEVDRIVNEPLSKQQLDHAKVGLNMKAAIEFLGLDKAAFAELANSGKSLTEIAADKGYTRQQLIDALLIDVEAQAKKLVDIKQLTQAEADQAKKDARASVDRFVDEKLKS